MTDKNNQFTLVVDEENQTKPISMKKALFQEKSRGTLSQSSPALCLTIEKSGGYGVPSMTEADRPSSKRKITILCLFALLIIFGILLFFLYNPSTGPQDPPKEDGIKARKNMTASLSVVPENLTLATLLAAKMEEPQGGAMRNCLEKAAQEFSEEPGIVQKNAKMTLRCNRTKREFLSGKGENLIEVVWINEKVSYTLVHEAHPDVHLARLGRHPFPLSLDSILRVLQDVISYNGSEELRSCLREALKQLPCEPLIVQDNAKMVVSCGGKSLTFISGEGQTEINVFREEPHGEIQYVVKATGKVWLSRYFKRGKLC